LKAAYLGGGGGPELRVRRRFGIKGRAKNEEHWGGTFVWIFQIKKKTDNIGST